MGKYIKKEGERVNLFLKDHSKKDSGFKSIRRDTLLKPSDTIVIAGAKIGDSLNYTEIEPDGTIRFAGEATVWDDLRSPATAINPPGQLSDPGWDNVNGGFLFDSTSTELLWIILQLPHGYKEGGNIRPHLHWMPTNTNTGNVLWRMEYKWTNVGEVDAASFIPVDSITPGDGDALKQQIASFGEIDGTGKKISSMLSIKLSRIGGDVLDTYTADALLKEFDIHFEIDTIGSREPFIK